MGVHDNMPAMRVLILATIFFVGGRKSAVVHTSQPPPKFIWVKFKYIMVHISLTYIISLFRNIIPVLHTVSLPFRKCEERKTLHSMNRSKSLGPSAFILLRYVPRFISRADYSKMQE
jgi:hypothetical protein